jgi:hypothetical protein
MEDRVPHGTNTTPGKLFNMAGVTTKRISADT